MSYNRFYDNHDGLNGLTVLHTCLKGLTGDYVCIFLRTHDRRLLGRLKMALRNSITRYYVGFRELTMIYVCLLAYPPLTNIRTAYDCPTNTYY